MGGGTKKITATMKESCFSKDKHASDDGEHTRLNISRGEWEDQQAHWTGCDILPVIREEGDDNILIRECFVWGLMDAEYGEVLPGMEDQTPGKHFGLDEDGLRFS